MDFEETVTYLTKKWGNKTLTAFRAQAFLETTGTAFESLRAQEGQRNQRVMVLMCVTDAKPIRVLEEVMDFAEQEAVDWDTFTLGEMAMGTVAGGGTSYHEMRDPSGNRVCIVLCATSPESVRTLEGIFKF